MQETFKILTRISPGVEINEISTFNKEKYPFLTAIIGDFEKGMEEPMIVDSIPEFLYYFGNNNSFDTKAALSFLKYSPSLLVYKIQGKTSKNADTENQGLTINTLQEFYDIPNFLTDNGFRAIARTPGKWGNDIQVSLFTSLMDSEILISDNMRLKEFENNPKFPGYHGYDEIYIGVFYKGKLEEAFVFNYWNPIDDMARINKTSKFIYFKFNINLKPFTDDSETFNTFNNSENLETFNNSETFENLDNDNELEISEPLINSQVTTFKPFLERPIIYNLYGGLDNTASKNDYLETFDFLNNENNYDIDFFLATHGVLTRKDVINFVPLKSINYKDFINEFNNINIFNNFENIQDFENSTRFFIYGSTELDGKFPTIFDYAGLKSLSILKEGLGRSISNINYTYDFNLTYNPKLAEEDLLYANRCNYFVKYQNSTFANGELIESKDYKGLNLTNRITINRLLRSIKKILINNVFEFNDDFTRNDIYTKINTLLKNAKQRCIRNFELNIEEFDRARPHNLDINVIIYLPNFVEKIILNFREF